jgi:apolipoprotein D and lipocalin family protein
MKLLKSLSWLWIIAGLAGCAGTPTGVDAVSGFQIERYTGKWYEIARLDHPFERGLSNVTAHYSLRKDGDIRVINRGYNESAGRWEEAEGRAKFIAGPDVGHLKVSFFGPFYGGYNIIALDRQSYQYALVAGNDRDYLWILSRSPELGADVTARLLQKAESLGFAVDELIFVPHDRRNP